MSEENKQEKDDLKKDVQVPDKFKSLVKEIEKMSVLDLSELEIGRASCRERV